MRTYESGIRTGEHKMLEAIRGLVSIRSNEAEKIDDVAVFRAMEALSADLLKVKKAMSLRHDAEQAQEWKDAATKVQIQ